MSWPTYSLDELGVVSRGRSRHRPRDAQHLYGGPFPFVQTGDVKAAPLYLTSYTQTYSEAGLAQSKLWPAGTLCITIAANIAETCILGIDACFPDSIIGFVADPAKANTTFIKYQFDAVMREKMKRVSQGVAQDNLSQEKLLSFRFPVPDLPTQQRIAGILSAYDDLIENNRRRIGLLEQAARLLYREWFVHLRFPGHETAKIVDALPEGWSRARLGDICSTNKKSHKAGKLPPRLRYIDIGSVSTGRIEQATEMTAEEAPGRARRIAEDGNTIWSNVRPNLRAYALVMAPRPEDVFSTGFTVLHAETVSPYFLYLAVTTDDFVKHLENHATGVGYPAVRADDFERALVIKPSEPVMAKFHDHCQPIFAERQKLFDQNVKLTRARDLLLPRLMDGRIPV